MCADCRANGISEGLRSDRCFCGDHPREYTRKGEGEDAASVASVGPGGVDGAKILEAMVATQTQMGDVLAKMAEKGGTQQKATLRVPVQAKFPEGSLDALENLQEWFREFDRVVHHCSGGAGLLASERVAHIVSLWAPQRIP